MELCDIAWSHVELHPVAWSNLE